MEIKYSAKKINGYTLEPLFDKVGASWQSHHVTNPTVIRLSGDERVFLGYRAGGDRDHYCIYDNNVVSSSLGMAILNETAQKVLYRFPLPIMKIKRISALPQSTEEYETYINSEHKNDIAVLHDFRLYEHNKYLYVIYHDGKILQAYDVIKRMTVKTFKEKIEKSIILMEENTCDILEQWNNLWWENDVWESCGAEGRLLFATYKGESPNKSDITYYNLNGKMQMMRRPLPDVSVLSVEDNLYGTKTVEGNQDFGVMEQCIRPGYFDNSHIGPNGMPTAAKIGEKEVYIEVCHGVHNKALAKEQPEFSFQMTYSPYLRIKDAKTGDLLYYSDDPIIDPDDSVWEEYTRRGRWISALSHEYILFVGGQTEMYKGKNGIEDKFVFFAGVGDTAIAQAEFTIKDLTPFDVLTDILVKDEHMHIPLKIAENEFKIEEKVAGWNWFISNAIDKRCVKICRQMKFKSINATDKSTRFIYNRPGYFDSDLMEFDGKAVVNTEIGYAFLYKGIRFTKKDGKETTNIGFGIIVLDKENLERVLYRSFEAINDTTISFDGHSNPQGIEYPKEYLTNILDYIPQNVKSEILYAEKLVKKGVHWRSHHTAWLEQRSQSEADI